MSDTKFTPGPWSVGETQIIMDEVTLVESASFGIAGVVGGLDDGEQEANARLIAAAPDMLDALRRCAAILPQYHMMGKTLGDDEVHSQVMEDVADAIAKAVSP